MSAVPYPSRLALLAALLMTIAAFMVGPVHGEDLAIGRELDQWRIAHHYLQPALIGVTFLGRAEVLLPLMFLAACYLYLRGDTLEALWLVGVLLTGRTLVEILKEMIDRPRPELSPRVVEVQSMSFPSGHAGNSMMTMLALALWLSPPRWRGPAVAGAMLASFTIGMTRPLLGVHWMSDVLAGWGLGMAWVTLGWWVSRRAIGKA